MARTKGTIRVFNKASFQIRTTEENREKIKSLLSEFKEKNDLVIKFFAATL